ncbi:hypothetical protein SAMN02982985_02856 [Rugamonas rubra]|uniref:Uncharacterized protein n=1 Tax=Rugamonas rubra TaxID=758825 RepID=A0A1I4NC89_9BURK|nr:hypothetical protein SAMN02982985_02856 [Rugamonas rubra]
MADKRLWLMPSRRASSAWERPADFRAACNIGPICWEMDNICFMRNSLENVVLAIGSAV